MFLLSKILALLTQPIGWVAVLLVLALFWFKRKPRRARGLLALSIVLLLLLGWMPLPDALLRHLEGQYAEIAPDTDLRGFEGVIVLGGATESGLVSQAHVHPLVNDAAERMTAAVALMQRHPHLKVVFTGGEGALLGSGPSEAERARGFFESLGAKGPRMRYEAVSRNTYENAVLTAQLEGVEKTRRWLLITSAWHMPRSMGAFVKAGWNVTAYPVDFRTAPASPWTDYTFAAGISRWQIALHEYLGWLSYRITGRL